VLLNIIKTPITQGLGKWKTDPETLSETRSAPEVISSSDW